MAQSTPPEDGPQHARVPLTIQAVRPQIGGLVVTSPALDADGWLDPMHSADGDNLSPALSWSRVLEAQSFALVVEDPDAPRDEPFVHWLIWDIPGDATGLPSGVGADPRPSDVPGAIQGRNDAGGHGWYGMKPPVGHGVHRYHFQVFALSKPLGMPPETPLVELLNALKGTTLASGELVGLYETRDPLADAASPARTGSYGARPADARPSARDISSGRGGLDRDDVDRHAPHDEDGVIRRRGGEDRDLSGSP